MKAKILILYTLCAILAGLLWIQAAYPKKTYLCLTLAGEMWVTQSELDRKSSHLFAITHDNREVYLNRSTVIECFPNKKPPEVKVEPQSLREET